MTTTAPETAAMPATPAVPWDTFFRGVEPYVQQLAGRLARQFPELPPEDAKQELVLTLLPAHHLYDPRRSRPTTWVHVRYAFLAGRLWKRRSLKKRLTLVHIDTAENGYAFDAADPKACDPVEVLEDADDQARLRQALRRLAPRWRRVLALRYGLSGTGEERTLKEVGEELGVTRERVRQLERKALRKLAVAMGTSPGAVTPTRKTRSRRKGTAERRQLASGAT